jgi:hypothetical protein
MRRFRLPMILACRNRDTLLQTIETSPAGALKVSKNLLLESGEIIAALISALEGPRLRPQVVVDRVRRMSIYKGRR